MYVYSHWQIFSAPFSLPIQCTGWSKCSSSHAEWVDKIKICNSFWDLKFTSDISGFSLNYKEFMYHKGLWLSPLRFTTDLPDTQLLCIFSKPNTQACLHAVQSFGEKEMCVYIYEKNNPEYTYSQTLFVASWSKKGSCTKLNSLVYRSSAAAC